MIDGVSLENSSSCCPCCEPQVKEVVHLPVAPQLVARTRFSPPPPGLNQGMSADEALQYLDRRMEETGGKVSMAAITGPGDPLATPELTFAVAESIKANYPNLPIGILTLGLGSSRLAGDLAHAGITYAEMKVEGVRAEILEKLFAWIRPGAKTLKLSDAVALLLQEQREGVSALKFRQITVSILTTLYPGYNTDHITKISSEMVELGADTISLVPYCPEPAAEVMLEGPTPEVVAEAKKKAKTYLPVVPSLLHHHSGYLADAENANCLMPKPSEKRPNVAVVSSNGIEVDLHLGHAIQFLIYGPREDGLACLLEARPAPEPGSGADRWLQAAKILKDCFMLLTASAGEKPRRLLSEQGLKVCITEDNIEGMVDVLYGGGKKKGKK